jgi:hypothetical protein
MTERNSYVLKRKKISTVACPFCSRKVAAADIIRHVKVGHTRVRKNGWMKVRRIIEEAQGQDSYLLKEIPYTAPPRTKLVSGGGTGVGGRRR